MLESLVASLPYILTDLDCYAHLDLEICSDIPSLSREEHLLAPQDSPLSILTPALLGLCFLCDQEFPACPWAGPSAEVRSTDHFAVLPLKAVLLGGLLP